MSLARGKKKLDMGKKKRVPEVLLLVGEAAGGRDHAKSKRLREDAFYFHTTDYMQDKKNGQRDSIAAETAGIARASMCQ